MGVCVLLCVEGLSTGERTGSESGQLKAVHSSRHKWPGVLVNWDFGRLNKPRRNAERAKSGKDESEYTYIVPTVPRSTLRVGLMAYGLRFGLRVCFFGLGDCGLGMRVGCVRVHVHRPHCPQKHAAHRVDMAYGLRFWCRARTLNC